MAAIDTLALISYGLSSNGSFLPNLREREGRGRRGEGRGRGGGGEGEERRGEGEERRRRGGRGGREGKESVDKEREVKEKVIIAGMNFIHCVN